MRRPVKQQRAERQHTGANRSGVRLAEWGAAESPYYEKAMMMRSRENTIYFASERDGGLGGRVGVIADTGGFQSWPSLIRKAFSEPPVAPQRRHFQYPLTRLMPKFG